jgi:hypothetical protein
MVEVKHSIVPPQHQALGERVGIGEASANPCVAASPAATRNCYVARGVSKAPGGFATDAANSGSPSKLSGFQRAVAKHSED